MSSQTNLMTFKYYIISFQLSLPTACYWQVWWISTGSVSTEKWVLFQDLSTMSSPCFNSLRPEINGFHFKNWIKNINRNRYCILIWILLKLVHNSPVHNNSALFHVMAWWLFGANYYVAYPDRKVHGANMEPTWGRQDPGGSHIGPMNFAIWVNQWRPTHTTGITRPQWVKIWMDIGRFSSNKCSKLLILHVMVNVSCVSL